MVPEQQLLGHEWLSSISCHLSCSFLYRISNLESQKGGETPELVILPPSLCRTHLVAIWGNAKRSQPCDLGGFIPRRPCSQKGPRACRGGAHMWLNALLLPY